MRRLIVLLTIAAMIGTLSGCGRYGRPERRKPADTLTRPQIFTAAGGALARPFQPDPGARTR